MYKERDCGIEKIFQKERSYSFLFEFTFFNIKRQEKYTKLYELPPDNHPFVRFEALFPFVIYANQWRLGKRTFDLLGFCRTTKKSKALFVEFTVEPFNNKAISYYKKVVDVYKKKFGLYVSFNKAFLRVKPVNALITDTEKFLKTKRPALLGGIDLLAEETNASALERGQAYFFRIVFNILNFAGMNSNFSLVS